MIAPALPLAAINHVLQQAPWACTRLAGFAGKMFELDIAPLKLRLAISAQGLLFVPGEAQTANVQITLPAGALPQALGGMDALFRQARISGEVEFAEAIAFVARNLRWDAEEDLSRFIGDIAAHRLIATARALWQWQKQSAVNLAENVAEYLTEERPVLMKPAGLRSFIEEVDALRDDLARLEKRVGRLGR
jgi:ubiquinone biosynthesis protein UbiJ